MNSESQLPTLEEIMGMPAAKLAELIRGGIEPVTTAAIFGSPVYKHIKATLLEEDITPDTPMSVLGPRESKLGEVIDIFFPSSSKKVPPLKPEDAVRGRQLHSNPHQREQTQKTTLRRGADLGLRDKESP